jgi:hypothetical protein
VPAQHAFEALTVRHRREVRDLARRYASGAIDADGFGDRLHLVIYRGHSDAVTLGRHLAGDRHPQTEDDQLLGSEAADLDADYLNAFVADLKSGRYHLENGLADVDAISRRADFYAVKYRDSANQAFVDTSAEDELWHWRLGPTEHCADCQDLADLSPMTKHELWTTPGACDTDCKLGCACHLVRDSDGKQGFARV